MTVLEFDKFKKLITSWPIAYYGETQDLSLEFDLPTCACFESVNNITLNFYIRVTITRMIIPKNYSYNKITKIMTY